MSGGSGADQVNTMFFDATSPLTAQDAATAVHNFWDGIKVHLDQSYHLQVDPNVETIDYTTGLATGATGVSTSPVVGANTNDPVPWGTQGLLQIRTPVFINGRQQRGRIFIPGPCENDNTGGVPSTTYKADVLAAAATLISDINSNLQVYSRKNHLGSVVTVAAIWAKWANLRTRRD